MEAAAIASQAERTGRCLAGRAPLLQLPGTENPPVGMVKRDEGDLYR
jgi:hypothetical protein